MSFTDEQKKEILLGKMKDVLFQMADGKTYNEFVIDLMGLTKTRIKNKLKQAIQAEKIKYTEQAINHTSTAADLAELEMEINSY